MVVRALVGETSTSQDTIITQKFDGRLRAFILQFRRAFTDRGWRDFGRGNRFCGHNCQKT